MSAPTPAPRQPAGSPIPALATGLLLGLAILKFGNPVILEQQVGIPGSPAEWIQSPWPSRLGLGLFAAVAILSAFMTPWLSRLREVRVPKWVWISGGLWIGWQFLSAVRSVDSVLTGLTLPHLVSVGFAFVLGLVLGAGPWRPVLVGLGIGASLCWLQAVNQHTVEFRTAREVLLTGERSGWTNVAPEILAAFRADGLVIRTNDVEIANPAIIDKLTRGRVYGTLVYPNALAGLVLLVFPILAGLLAQEGARLRPVVRIGALGLLGLLAGGSLFWSGSRSGWLIAVLMLGGAVFLLPGARKYRIPLLIGAIVIGIGGFFLRNQGYLQKGATSVSARIDYWQAAVRNTLEHPLVGSGPGTFMRPYARLKTPEAEMARLTHNDYLQQFSDSGIPGGLAYLGWVGGTLLLAWKRIARHPDLILRGLLLGVTGWLIQGLSEFSLYVPALAWTSFTLLGIGISVASSLHPLPRSKA